MWSFKNLQDSLLTTTVPYSAFLDIWPRHFSSSLIFILIVCPSCYLSQRTRSPITYWKQCSGTVSYINSNHDDHTIILQCYYHSHFLNKRKQAQRSDLLKFIKLTARKETKICHLFSEPMCLMSFRDALAACPPLTPGPPSYRTQENSPYDEKIFKDDSWVQYTHVRGWDGNPCTKKQLKRSWENRAVLECLKATSVVGK